MREEAIEAMASALNTAARLLADRPLTLAALQAGAEERKLKWCDEHEASYIEDIGNCGYGDDMCRIATRVLL